MTRELLLGVRPAGQQARDEADVEHLGQQSSGAKTVDDTALGCSWRLKGPLCVFVMPNVRAKRATTVGRQARAGENAPCATGPGLVACRWRSA